MIPRLILLTFVSMSRITFEYVKLLVLLLKNLTISISLISRSISSLKDTAFSRSFKFLGATNHSWTNFNVDILAPTAFFTHFFGLISIETIL